MNQTPNSPPPAPTAPYASRLVFEGDAFVYGGRRYLYKDVRHIEFEQDTKRLNLNEPTVQWEFSSTLRVGMDTGKWVSIRLITTIRAVQKTATKSWHASMVQAAERLSALTFNPRMDALMQEVGARKYMRQGVYQVTTNGDLFKRYAFCLNIRSELVNNMLFTNRLVSVRKPKRWWRRVLWSFAHTGERIDLTRDRDCFLYFLRFYTGLYWPNETVRLWHGRAADGSTPKTAEHTGGKNDPHAEMPVQPKPVATSVQHLATLGLTVDAKWDEVRGTYRQLARLHHPDLMRGRGAEAEAIKKAEDTLKSINHAYGWLEDFYRLKPKR